MPRSKARASRRPLQSSGDDIEADVLAIGGGPAGTWAAVSAARAGAKVILADKGFCGTSGATAPSGTGIWYVPNDPVVRRQAHSGDGMATGILGHRAGNQATR